MERGTVLLGGGFFLSTKHTEALRFYIFNVSTLHKRQPLQHSAGLIGQKIATLSTFPKMLQRWGSSKNCETLDTNQGCPLGFYIFKIEARHTRGIRELSTIGKNRHRRHFWNTIAIERIAPNFLHFLTTNHGSRLRFYIFNVRALYFRNLDTPRALYIFENLRARPHYSTNSSRAITSKIFRKYNDEKSSLFRTHFFKFFTFCIFCIQTGRADNLITKGLTHNQKPDSAGLWLSYTRNTPAPSWRSPNW